jgi:hypothetical protein
MEKLVCKNCDAENRTNAKYCSQCGYELPKTDFAKEEPVVYAQRKSGIKNSKLLGGILGVVLTALTSFAVQQIFFKAPELDKVLIKEANELNKNCPFMVDQVTRLDNALVLPNKTFVYNYTLIGMDKSQVNIDTLKKYLEPGILNNIRTNPDMAKQREYRVTLVYSYKDEKGEFIHKFTITPDMYK